MPTYTISCQVVVWAGEVLQYRGLFHFSLWDSALHLFLSFYKRTKPKQNDDVLQNILKSKPVQGKMGGSHLQSNQRFRGTQNSIPGPQLPCESPAIVTMCCHLDAI